MSDRVDCPVCGTTTPRDAYPRHLAEDHLSGRLDERYGFSASWAGVLAALALVVLAGHVAVFVDPDRVRAALAAATGPEVVNERLVEVTVWLALTLASLALGWTATAVSRGPGQSIRPGWRPSRREYAAVTTWGVPFVGPIIYLVGASRRFVGVRYAREKTVAVVATASNRFADAERALQEDRDADATATFRDVAGQLNWLLDDPHVRTNRTGDRLAALQGACERAVDVHEDRLAERATEG